MAVRPLPAGRRPLLAMTEQAGMRAGSARNGEPEQVTQGDREGTGKPFHGEVKRGGAMTDGGKNVQGSCTLLKL